MPGRAIAADEFVNDQGDEINPGLTLVLDVATQRHKKLAAVICEHQGMPSTEGRKGISALYPRIPPMMAELNVELALKKKQRAATKLDQLRSELFTARMLSHEIAYLCCYAPVAQSIRRKVREAAKKVLPGGVWPARFAFAEFRDQLLKKTNKETLAKALRSVRHIDTLIQKHSPALEDGVASLEHWPNVSSMDPATGTVSVSTPLDGPFFNFDRFFATEDMATVRENRDDGEVKDGNTEDGNGGDGNGGGIDGGDGNGMLDGFDLHSLL